MTELEILTQQLAIMTAQNDVLKSMNTLLLILALFEVWKVARGFSKKGVRNNG